MNKMKKFASIATAVLMTACMAAPMTMSLTASAEDVEISITLPNPLPANSSLQEIYAYQIFAGTYQEPTGTATEGTLNISGWGNGINVDDFIKELKANDAFKDENGTSAFDNVTYDANNPAVSAQAVADIIGKWQDDSADAKAFAKLAVLNKNANNQIGGIYDQADSKVTFTDTDLADGYYLFTCELDNVTNSTPYYDSMSLGMLTIIDNSATDLQIGSEGTAKVGLPEVMKKVYENTKTSATSASIGKYNEDDVKWNDVADYCIGDSVPFKLYGTMPQDIGNYEHYYYQFTDTLGKEFTAPKSVTIKVNNTPVTAVPTNSDMFTSIKTDETTKITTITVSFEDIKEVIKSVTNKDASETDVITVEYNAVLNSNAKIGLPGQENKVDLTYSNNPNIAYKPSNNDENSDDTPGTPKNPGTPGTPETPDKPGKPGDNTGTTPEDKVIVFTYEADFTKIDSVTKLPLENVEFKLKNSANQYVIVDTDGKVTGWGAEAEGSTLVSGADGTFKVIGLDDGEYTLIETKALEGYNPMENTKITITAGTVNNQTWSGTDIDALTSFKYKVGTADEVDQTPITGIAKGTIENKKGSSLPSTGGIGTTLFYVGGGAMVAVAGVFLITKKRMGKKED